MAAEKVDLDYVLVNELGQFGKYQALTVLFVSFPMVFSAFAQDYIFTASSVRTRCLVPECDDSNPEFTPNWLLNAIPGDSLTSFDNCNRYVNQTNEAVNQTAETCPATLFNQVSTISCDSYVYERTNSIVYDFGIECREWLRALVGTLQSVGTLFVLPVSAYISDRFGRKVALLINAINFSVVGFIRSFSVNYYMFIALYMLQTAIGAGAYTSGFILGTELVGPKYRVMVGNIFGNTFAVGQVILGLIAWGLSEWRDLTLAIYIPQLVILIPFIWLIDESVRWTISRKKYTEAKQVLLKAAKMNKREISEKTLKTLFTDEAVEENSVEKESELSLVKQIIRSPVMLKRVFTTPVWWVSTTLIYYGLSINSTGLVGNMYLNFILVALIEVPGNWTAYFVLDKLGRKWPLFTSFFVCSVCQIVLIFIPSDMPTTSLIVYLIGKYAISFVFTTIYIYTAELYPTKYRQTLLSFSSMIGRIGSILAPLTPALAVYWDGLPSLIFGVFAFASAFLSLTTPETLGVKLPDTIDDAINIGKLKPDIT